MFLVVRDIEGIENCWRRGGRKGKLARAASLTRSMDT